jgi:Aldehyde dehydrogenase family
MLLIIVDDSEGYFVWPTVIVSKDPKSQLMTEEIFGPVLTVRLYHGEADRRCTYMKMKSSAIFSNWWTSPLNMLLRGRCLSPRTSAFVDVRFATERAAVVEATNALRYSAGLFPHRGGADNRKFLRQ